jgi:hypothetical protein
MTLRRAWFIAACLVAALPAAAQFPPQPQAPAAQFPPAGQQQPNSSWPAGPQQPSPFPPFGQQQATPQQAPPCLQEFGRLRDDTEKKGNALRQASERHATPKEACGLFIAFTNAEAKFLKYATDNANGCGIPQKIIAQIKLGHGRAMDIRNKVCQAAAQGGAPAAARQPTLSDALGAPVTDSSNIKTGRGTFDTLTGTPLGQK